MVVIMKTILLPFFDDEPAAIALETACRVASRFASHIEGLFILRPPQIFDGEGIALAGSYLTQIKEEGRRLAESAHQRFEREMSARRIPITGLAGSMEQPHEGPTAGWGEIDGLEGQVVGDYGRLFNLIVVGREYGQPWIDWNVLSEAALFESGRPLLVAAPEVPEQIGENVVVAWNGSTETARATALAMPLLRTAKKVTVLIVEGGMLPGPSGEDMALHLARGGIAVHTQTVGLEDRSIGEAILTAARNLGADLIVKGAYTHSRLREMVFGGATRHLLMQADLPVLMAR